MRIFTHCYSETSFTNLIDALDDKPKRASRYTNTAVTTDTTGVYYYQMILTLDPATSFTRTEIGRCVDRPRTAVS